MQSFYLQRGKRWLDLFLSSLGLFALSPWFLIWALLIRFSSPGPVFFRQVRTGLNGRQFRIFKFRTMFIRSDAHTCLLTASDDSRITPVGRWLRKTKIDELPQLINVVTGDMSLVGPRPEVPLYTNLYTQEQRRILSVKPGITGRASIAFAAEEKLLAGRADTEHFYVSILMPYKIEIELQYCRRISLLGDLRVLLETILKLFKRPVPFVIPDRYTTTSQD